VLLVRIDLKVAIIRSEKSQRQISIEAAIAETRLSDIVRRRADPTPGERDRLERALDDSTIFRDEPAIQQRSRR
jgi:hypothetical protein